MAGSTRIQAKLLASPPAGRRRRSGGRMGLDRTQSRSARAVTASRLLREPLAELEEIKRVVGDAARPRRMFRQLRRRRLGDEE